MAGRWSALATWTMALPSTIPSSPMARFDLSLAATDAVLTYAYRKTRRQFFSGQDMVKLIEYTHSEEEMHRVMYWLAKNKVPALIENINKARNALFGVGHVKRVVHRKEVG